VTGITLAGDERALRFRTAWAQGAKFNRSGFVPLWTVAGTAQQSVAEVLGRPWWSSSSRVAAAAPARSRWAGPGSPWRRRLEPVIPTVALNDGTPIPQLGFGTLAIPPNREQTRCKAPKCRSRRTWSATPNPPGKQHSQFTDAVCSMIGDERSLPAEADR
jgi:hypothetical protein